MTNAPARTGRRGQGFLAHPALDPTSVGARLDDFTAILVYGTKAAGLQILPPAWVPPYVAVPAWAFEEWARQPQEWLARLERNHLDLRVALQLTSDGGRHPLIVRSSAVGERLEDRGLYKSLCLNADARVDQLAAAIEEIYRDFAGRARHSAIGILVQRCISRELAGHVSNEIRLSATRNQWKYVIEAPAFGPESGLNSKFAQGPDENSPLILASLDDIGASLRRVCHWVNLHVDRRTHLEWCAASGRLWIVQLDSESPTSAGIDPHLMPDARGADTLVPDSVPSGIFKPYRIEDGSPWRKLRNLGAFWTGTEKPRHRLFFATGDSLQAVLAGPGGVSALSAEIDWLTGGRAVLRTDCNDPQVRPFNLPRTHTVDGATAVAWITETLVELVAKGAAVSQIAVILHRYIPARAAAWTYYSPGDEIVLIDGLWGLPDGLQFLSHDSFQVDARTGEELAAAIRFKPNFLQEQEDGTWRYVDVARLYGRDRALSREALRVMALETVAVAKKVEDRAQIMWFCDLPRELGLGQYLPWYRSMEFAGYEPAKRPPLPTRNIQNLADLEDVDQKPERCILSVAPEVQLIRDDDHFLDRVIAVAQAHNLPVELKGSVLGHAYYRLRDAGVIVLVPHPKYDRVRGRRRHYKVVRDDIPDSIAAKGERVSFGRLAPSEASIALIGKLFEEGLELGAATGSAEKREELADVLEVVRGLAVTGGITWDELLATAAEKRQKRGGFEQQTVLLETARPMPIRAGESSATESHSERVIQLRDLGVVTVQGARASISFSKLLSGEIKVELTVGSRRLNVAVTLDATGVVLHASEKQNDSKKTQTQLNLFDKSPGGADGVE